MADNGTVILSGHVYTDDERADAVRIAGGIQGVRRVDNRLMVVSYKSYKE
jgi:osmotically-inducible protein OsmY